MIHLMKFLKFASSGTLYRYNFHNQVLIYHIRPESSVVVPYESWRSVGRKPHFKTGIHINLDENFGNIKFNGCVFALEDTYLVVYGRLIVILLNMLLRCLKERKISKLP